MITIDASYGEGGGQVLRSSLTLAVLLGKPIRLDRVRARRQKPGLQPQHLASVRAAATVGGAQVEGAALGSQALVFEPQTQPVAGQYFFDISQLAGRGSAGTTGLVFQTIFLPLALAIGTSRIILRGGTHLPLSPAFHYIHEVFLPAVRPMGLEAELSLEQWGWYPIGGGEVRAVIHGRAERPQPVALMQPGPLQRVVVVCAASRLPEHVPQRMARRVEECLGRQLGAVPVNFDLVNAPSPGTGAGLFLRAEYENVSAGFTSIGSRGKPSESLADEVCAEFLAHHQTGRAVDPHLADQLILPMALASGASEFTTSQVTQHLLTNIWVVEQFLDVSFTVEGELGEPGRVVCRGKR